MSTRPGEGHGDPLHVWYASEMLLTAMDHACMRFAVRRDASGLTVVSPDGWSGDLKEFIRVRGCRDYSGNEDKPAPADLVWDRLLEMADMRGEHRPAGSLRLSQQQRYPYTDWTVRVRRDGPDRLDFELTLDRVDTSLPTPDAK